MLISIGRCYAFYVPNCSTFNVQWWICPRNCPRLDSLSLICPHYFFLIYWIIVHTFLRIVHNNVYISNIFKLYIIFCPPLNIHWKNVQYIFNPKQAWTFVLDIQKYVLDVQTFVRVVRLFIVCFQDVLNFVHRPFDLHACQCWLSYLCAVYSIMTHVICT